MPQTVAFVLKGYPRLSETFIAQEIKALEDRGLDIRIYSLRHPTDVKRHAVHGEIRAAVSYLPEYLYQEPLRVYRAWREIRRRPGYKAALAPGSRIGGAIPPPIAGADLGRPWCWRMNGRPTSTALHAHFLHTPASVTRYAALMLGLPWTGLGACQGHLDDTGLGKAREVGGSGVGRHLHGSERGPFARARAPA